MKRKYLPNTPQEALQIPLSSVGIPAVIEAIATSGANNAAKLAMARMISKVGRKYTQEARDYAARIGSGELPIPTVADIP